MIFKKKIKKMENNLPYPFNIAFERGHSIDYMLGGAEINDHQYVEKLGYRPEMSPDCAYYAKGLSGFSLSSYGDWGTFYSKDAGRKERRMFFDMLEKDIIRPWRITAYIKETHPKIENKGIKSWFRAVSGLENNLDDIDGKVVVTSYSYVDGNGWRKYDEEFGWVDCEDPYKN